MPASAISVSCDCFASKFRVRAIRLLHSGLGVGGGGDAKIQVRKYVCEMCHLFVALFAAWSVFTKEFQQNALAHMAMVAKFFTSTYNNPALSLQMTSRMFAMCAQLPRLPTLRNMIVILQAWSLCMHVTDGSKSFGYALAVGNAGLSRHCTGQIESHCHTNNHPQVFEYESCTISRCHSQRECSIVPKMTVDILTCEQLSDLQCAISDIVEIWSVNVNLTRASHHDCVQPLNPLYD